MIASNFSSVLKRIHTRHCAPRERLCWGMCPGLTHAWLPLHTETRAQPEGQLPAGLQCPLPGTPCLAPQPHTKQTGCLARTQQCLPCLGSPSTVNDLYNGLLTAFLLCSFFSFFLHLLPKLRFLLVIPLSHHCCCSIPSWAWGQSPKHTCMSAQFCKCHIFFLNGMRSSYIPRQPHLCMSFHRGFNYIKRGKMKC